MRERDFRSHFLMGRIRGRAWLRLQVLPRKSQPLRSPLQDLPSLPEREKEGEVGGGVGGGGPGFPPAPLTQILSCAFRDFGVEPGMTERERDNLAMRISREGHSRKARRPRFWRLRTWSIGPTRHRQRSRRSPRTKIKAGHAQKTQRKNGFDRFSAPIVVSGPWPQ